MRPTKPTSSTCESSVGTNANSGSEDSPSPCERAAWGYSHANGPGVWGRLSPEYALCETGSRQSPVDLRDPRIAELPSIHFNYRPGAVTVRNHSHTIDVVVGSENWIEVGGERYDLLQFHFHAPSEHTVEGRSFDMEMHLVHRNGEGGLAVIGVLIERGSRHIAFDSVWAHLPQAPGEMQRIEGVSANPGDFLPHDRRTYRYDGSLTTPPCFEDVSWLVFAAPIEMSEAQIAAFTAIVPRNNRPAQALNGREILMDNGKEE